MNVYDKSVGILFFYSNGIFFQSAWSDKQTKFEEMIQNGEFKSSFENNPVSWGLFLVQNDSIFIEQLLNPGYLSNKAYISSGPILNDSTFHLTKRMRSIGGEEEVIDYLNHFKQFSPKPDSTNNFIK
jgi:hypothetical protein